MGGYSQPRRPCKSGSGDKERSTCGPAQRFSGAERPEPGRADLARMSVKTTLGSNRNGRIGLPSARDAVRGPPKYQQVSLGRDLSWARASLFYFHKLILGGNASPSWVGVGLKSRKRKALLRPEVVRWLEH